MVSPIPTNEKPRAAGQTYFMYLGVLGAVAAVALMLCLLASVDPQHRTGVETLLPTKSPKVMDSDDLTSRGQEDIILGTLLGCGSRPFRNPLLCLLAAAHCLSVMFLPFLALGHLVHTVSVRLEPSRVSGTAATSFSLPSTPFLVRRPTFYAPCVCGPPFGVFWRSTIALRSSRAPLRVSCGGRQMSLSHFRVRQRTFATVAHRVHVFTPKLDPRLTNVLRLDVPDFGFRAVKRKHRREPESIFPIQVPRSLEVLIVVPTVAQQGPVLTLPVFRLPRGAPDIHLVVDQVLYLVDSCHSTHQQQKQDCPHTASSPDCSRLLYHWFIVGSTATSVAAQLLAETRSAVNAVRGHCVRRCLGRLRRRDSSTSASGPCECGHTISRGAHID